MGEVRLFKIMTATAVSLGSKARGPHASQAPRLVSDRGKREQVEARANGTGSLNWHDYRLIKILWATAALATRVRFLKSKAWTLEAR